jgi:D-alanine-D-alanine ligase
MADSEAADGESLVAPVPPSVWFRPKGNLTTGELSFLLILAILPLVMVIVRVLSLPDVLSAELSGSWFSVVGSELSSMLSLHDIPAGDRASVLYMLFLPTSALLIAIVRLTLGIRVIGFRAILISVGFQESGVIPSLILIIVVVAIVVGVRPALRRIRLPQVARLSVIMSIAVVILLSALLLAPWTRSEVLWGVAFFPVIVLGLLAEGIAKTLDSGSGLVAIWRTGMTIGIALLLAGVSQIPALREVALAFPELVLTQIALIIFVAEYFDLRLFQDWDSKLSGVAIPRFFERGGTQKIAVVFNRRKNGIVAPLGTSAGKGYRPRDVRRLAAMLRDAGHRVERFEGDMTMLSKLREFMPPHPRTGEPGGLVLNLATGIQGTSATGHVPAMLEMAGLPYAGATPTGHAIIQDRVLSSQVLGAAGVRIPDLRIVRSEGEDVEGLTYPLAVRPRQGSSSRIRLARDRAGLDSAIRRVLRRAGPEAVIEQFITGRRIDVALIGNESPECLPLVEVLPETDERICPALLEGGVAERIREAARLAYEACGCRDAARISLRLTQAGTPYVTEVESLGGLDQGGLFECAGKADGVPLGDLIERIVDVASERYRSGAQATALSLVGGAANEAGRDGRALIAGS